MQMNPYQMPQVNSYAPQYQQYQQAYNPMQNIQRCEAYACNSRRRI